MVESLPADHSHPERQRYRPGQWRPMAHSVYLSIVHAPQRVTVTGHRWVAGRAIVCGCGRLGVDHAVVVKHEFRVDGGVVRLGADGDPGKVGKSAIGS